MRVSVVGVLVSGLELGDEDFWSRVSRFWFRVYSLVWGFGV